MYVYQEGRGVQQILVSGGGTEETPYAETVQRFLVAGGVPAGVIRTETLSKSTRESALEVTRLLRDTPGRKILLTSDYHMFRAAREHSARQAWSLNRGPFRTR